MQCVKTKGHERPCSQQTALLLGSWLQAHPRHEPRADSSLNPPPKHWEDLTPSRLDPNTQCIYLFLSSYRKTTPSWYFKLKWPHYKTDGSRNPEVYLLFIDDLWKDMCRSKFSLKLPWVIWQQRDYLQEGTEKHAGGQYNNENLCTKEWPESSFFSLIFSKDELPGWTFFYHENHQGATCRQVCRSAGVSEAGANIRQWLKWHVTHIPKQVFPCELFLYFYNPFFFLLSALTVGVLLLAVSYWNTEWVIRPWNLSKIIHET
jgi:hypothetical protein